MWALEAGGELTLTPSDRAITTITIFTDTEHSISNIELWKPISQISRLHTASALIYKNTWCPDFTDLLFGEGFILIYLCEDGLMSCQLRSSEQVRYLAQVKYLVTDSYTNTMRGLQEQSTTYMSIYSHTQNMELIIHHIRSIYKVRLRLSRNSKLNTYKLLEGITPVLLSWEFILHQ